MKIMQIIPADGWKAETNQSIVDLVCWALVDLSGSRRVFGMVSGSKGLEIVGPKNADWTENHNFVGYVR